MFLFDIYLFMYDKIIVISLDSLRNDCLKLAWIRRYDNLYKNTLDPAADFLDEISKKWVYFKNCYSAAPYTWASHGAIFSWKWPINNWLYEIYNNPINSKIIFEYFKEKEFKTIMDTDFPFILWEYLWLNAWVDDYFIEKEQIAIDRIEKNKNTLAFFHFWWIHYPYWFHKLKFWEDDYESKIHFLEEKHNIKGQKFSDSLIETYYDEKDLELLLKYKRIISILYENKEYEELFNLYLEWIGYFIKNRFSKFRESLMEKVEKENYLIVIFSDHGEERSEECFWHHDYLWDGILNVPLIFIAKDIKPRIIEDYVRTIDILPTILDMNAIKYDNLDWGSLRGFIENGDQKNKDDILYAQMRWLKDQGDFEKLKEIRYNMLRSSIKREKLEHILKKERITLWKITLMRDYINGILKSEKLFISDDGLLQKKIMDDEHKKYLNTLLLQYNNKIKASKQNQSWSWEVRFLLRNLWYDV